ncbi:inner membrane protein translocase [Corynebacterium suranareeae]|uniref:Membrane protein insertase YidC n=1 Tax=Corynebacterium suranareeae TaxID=2506452 RepID=A0A169S945_9CORY|nr:membrane protein insertase YidC [Corynebacterium suranareeae]BAU97305.1 inner membrane protein translocase [Corynebacterium suranareeae]
MLDILIYPVSGVMKLWHLLLHNVVGLDDSLAWFVSLFGLVITIRAIIAPFTWQMLKSGRAAAHVRPHRAAIRKEFEGKFDEASIREMQKRQSELNKEHGINPIAGCMPGLIQMPFILGLYWALLRMARPEGGLENPIINSIGFLSPEEVQSFLEGRINNVPLPAYVSMPTEQLEYLGTTQAEVLSFVLPLFIAAAIITAINMAMSMYRAFQTNDYASSVSNGMIKFMLVLSILAPIFPLSLGLTGPFPTAIALYWVSNNLWTLFQTIIMMIILERKYPLSEEFKVHHLEQRDKYRAKQKEKRSFLWTRRKNRALMLLTPWKASSLHAENVELTSARTKKINEQKQAQKEISTKRRETQREMNRAAMERLKKRRAEVKAKKKGLIDASPHDPSPEEKEEN